VPRATSDYWDSNRLRYILGRPTPLWVWWYFTRGIAKKWTDRGHMIATSLKTRDFRVITGTNKVLEKHAYHQSWARTLLLWTVAPSLIIETTSRGRRHRLFSHFRSRFDNNRNNGRIFPEDKLLQIMISHYYWWFPSTWKGNQTPVSCIDGGRDCPKSCTTVHFTRHLYITEGWLGANLRWNSFNGLTLTFQNLLYFKVYTTFCMHWIYWS
jgi:hypothetical protein